MRLTRPQARARGFMTYQIGKVCKRGHTPVRRYVQNGSCAYCNLEHSYEQLSDPKTRAHRYAAARKRYRANREAMQQWHREWRKKNRKKVRAWNRRAMGLPEPTRKEPTHCECCGRYARRKALQLDHCHKTNKFRGWLCRNCNFGLGALGDNAAGLRRAQRYLARAR